MQTFLPHETYAESAAVLDRMRLGKQRVEAWQILRALTGETKGWVNHPATVMWRGYENALCEYGIAICAEWQSRGYKDTLLDKFTDNLAHFAPVKPWWLSFEPLLASHRSNLYRKDPIHYSRYSYIGGDLPYVWCNPDGTWKFGK
jgi:hypothetical protein